MQSRSFDLFQKATYELTIDPTERQKTLIKKQQQEISKLESQKKKIDELEKAFNVLATSFLHTAGHDEDAKEVITEIIAESKNFNNIFKEIG